MSKEKDKMEEDIARDCEGEFCIIVEGQFVKCQKKLLIEKSEYFRAMIDSCMVESQTNTVTLKDQEFSVVKTLIDFILTGELSIECGGKNIKKLTQTAVMLQIGDAVQICTEYMKKMLDDENCLELMTLSQSLYLEELFSRSKRHALYYFKQVVQTTAFLQLDIAPLVTYLSSADLNCAREIEIMDAILAWYEHDRTRKTMLQYLLGVLYIDDIKDEEWAELKMHELLKVSDDWRKFVEDYVTSFKEKKQQECSIQGSLAARSRCRHIPIMLLSVGGHTGRDNKSKLCTDICSLDKDDRTFKPILTLKDVHSENGSKMGFQVTVVGKDMYLTGGQLTMSHYSMILDVWKLDGFDLKWEKVTKLTSPRRHHAACASPTSLFIMGGFGKYRDILDTIQEYDTQTGTWSDLPKMPYPLFSPQAVFCKNKLYVYKTCLICLDMTTLDWTTIRESPSNDVDMNTYIPHHFGDFIYEFPYLDDGLDWISDSEVGKLELRRTSLATLKTEVVPYSDSIQFRNRVVVCNDKFYTINRQTDDVICGSMTDFNECKVIGKRGQAGNDCWLVSLPHYPEYKIKSSN